jgi:hypothetical protein
MDGTAMDEYNTRVYSFFLSFECQEFGIALVETQSPDQIYM